VGDLCTVYEPMVIVVITPTHPLDLCYLCMNHSLALLVPTYDCVSGFLHTAAIN